MGNTRKILRTKQALEAICDWYRDLPRGYMDINELIYKRQKLVGYLSNYTDMIENLQLTLSSFENELESRKIYLRLKYQQKYGVGKADTLSRFKTVEEKDRCNKSTRQLQSMRDYVKAIQLVNDTMSQHIAILRNEKKL